MVQYLGERDLKIKDMKQQKCSQVFKFGPSKRYISDTMVELPLMVDRMAGKQDVIKLFVYLVEADVPFLCGKRMLESWDAKLNTNISI